jgi:anti-sigma regulatory factor (Ser/Thr protein kinase)
MNPVRNTKEVRQNSRISNNSENNLVKLEIKSHPRYLGFVRHAAFELAKLAGFTEDTAKDLRLVVDEACTNIIKHSYHYDYTKPIILNFFLYDDRLEILLEDYGEKVSPSRIQPREIDNVKPGGLGVYIIKKLTDVMEYDPGGEQGPKLRLVKYKKLKGKSGKPKI